MAYLNTVRQLQVAPTVEPHEHIRPSEEVSRHNYSASLRFEVDYDHPRPYSSIDMDTFRSETRSIFTEFKPKMWFAISYYYPEDTVDDPAAESIMQSWGRDADNNSKHSVSIRTENGDLILRLNLTDDEHRIDYNFGPVPTGEHFDFVMRIDSTPHDSGSIKVWLNNELVVDYQGAIIDYSADGINEYKWGLYKWGWHDSKNPPGNTSDSSTTTNRVLFVTHLRWAEINVPDHIAYQLVHPDGELPDEGVDPD